MSKNFILIIALCLSQIVAAQVVESTTDSSTALKQNAAVSLVPTDRQGADTLRFSLDSCMRYAYSHNLTVRNAQLSRDLAEENVKKAKMAFTPSLSASATQTFGFQKDQETSSDNNYGLNAGLTLFSGLSNINSYKQSQVSLDQSKLKIQQSQNSIGSQIVQAYLTILMNQEKLQYQKEVLKFTEEQRNEGAIKYQVGKILESDYLLLEASYESAVGDIENTRLTIESNRLALKDLLCIKENVVIDVVRSSDTLGSKAYTLPGLDEVVKTAYEVLPDLKISQMDVQIAEYNLKMAKAAYSPTLSLNGGSSYYGGGTQTVDANGTVISGSGVNANLGLSLSIPIFSRGTARYQVAQSKINLQEAQLQNDQTALTLRKEIEDQYMTTRQALNQFRVSELLQNAYKQSYEVYTVKYKAGGITTVDLLQQQDKYLSAMNTYLQNKYSFILSDKMLDIYMGKDITL